MRKKKILLLSVSAGAGHQRAAEAIRSAALLNDSQFDVLHLDAMQFVTAGFRKIYTDFYIKLVNKAPALWGYLYHASNEAQSDSTTEKLRRALERLNARSLLKAIEEFQADAIICTHFLPAEMLSREIRKQRLHCPVWVQVTDFDLHRMWVHEHMTGYFAASEEVADRMLENGIPVEKIHVTGIPIMPAFQQKLERTACAPEFGLRADITTILLMGGGAGLGGLDQVAARLLSQQAGFQLIVMAGKNATALQALQTLVPRYPSRLFPQGFTNQVERLMACSDLVITKPGGLTTSECLALGLPMIVNSPIPGQEERNADYLLEQGVALKAYDDISLAYRVKRLLDDTARLSAMHSRAKALGKPDAAARVLATVTAAL
ncbi:MGDG synthase family glycosyltransferase [Undibacterium rugosum]|uniref:Galactosyldiacylglycerol synthase n=1 Tax=Undibacterium rugosum TaxID=2762291 RepID=A0A923KZ95_9BURK|nr:glycosyltransferase [Undibacterium rugosum]MBC3935658.1 galactosyldiacylglycerol synthase [Undibacterium rugosum]MBR7778579.1 galactosyldiacylglycerol synthase [Undibacterium rugosum]